MARTPYFRIRRIETNCIGRSIDSMMVTQYRGRGRGVDGEDGAGWGVLVPGFVGEFVACPFVASFLCFEVPEGHRLFL